MPNDKSSLPDLPASRPASGQGYASPSSPEPRRKTLRGQVAEVIRYVLDDMNPAEEWARAQLRESLAAYPGRPERALLEHLIVTDSLTDAAQDATSVWEAPTENETPSITDAPRGLDAGRARLIEDVVENRMVLTALQPVRHLNTGRILGFEALTRFVSTDGAPAAAWFRDAAAVGFRTELEHAALESAVAAGQEIPSPLFIAVNLNPAALIDVGIQYLLLASSLPPTRIIIDLTEKASDQAWDTLSGILEKLRRHGLRISMTPDNDETTIDVVRIVRPDIIKIGREFTRSVSDGQTATVAAIGQLADEAGAVLTAEGIETGAELEALLDVGVTAGQGFLLGRPSANPDDWAHWTAQTDNTRDKWSTPRHGRKR